MPRTPLADRSRPPYSRSHADALPPESQPLSHADEHARWPASRAAIRTPAHSHGFVRSLLKNPFRADRAWCAEAKDFLNFDTTDTERSHKWAFCPCDPQNSNFDRQVEHVRHAQLAADAAPRTGWSMQHLARPGRLRANHRAHQRHAATAWREVSKREPSPRPGRPTLTPLPLWLCGRAGQARRRSAKKTTTTTWPRAAARPAQE